MDTSEEKAGATPNGGNHSVIYYQDDNGQPTTKDVATRAEVVEYNEQGKTVARTYASLRSA